MNTKDLEKRVNKNFNIMISNIEINIYDYVRDYLTKHDNIEILIGCDSQNKGRFSHYGLVLVLYTPGKGGHVLYSKFSIKRENERWNRLWKEVEYSIELANDLVSQGLPKAKYIDIDLNPDPKYKSNSVLRAAMGYVESMGYAVRIKPFSFASTYAADKICK